MAPRIGIAPGLDAGGRIRAGRRYHYLDAAYARAVADAGGLPLYLAAPGDPRALCDAVHGLLIPGGDDFPPAAPYPPEVRFTPVAPEQLAFDRALLRTALERGLPVLAICYGMQLLCLEAGGRLLHHVPIDAPEAGLHVLPEPDGRHALRVTPGTRLAEILGADPPPVNSLHHQAVAAPGRGLCVAARAPDGLIEAVEWADGADRRFVIGVQWHPEKLDGRHRERLFGAFVAACASAPARP